MSLFRAVGATGGTPKSLFADTTGPSNYMTLETPIGTDYVVPATKTFKITRISFRGTVGVQISIGYGDNGVAQGASPPTNPVYVIGNGSVSSLVTGVAETMYAIDIYAEIPTGKYPFLKGAYVGVQVIGVEE